MFLYGSLISQDSLRAHLSLAVLDTIGRIKTQINGSFDSKGRIKGEYQGTLFTWLQDSAFVEPEKDSTLINSFSMNVCLATSPGVIMPPTNYD